MKAFKITSVAAIAGILLLAAVFSSCEPNQETKDNVAKHKLFENSQTVNGYKITVLEYDSCEYLISGSGYSQLITHKGNCKYCRERQLNSR